LKPEGEGEIFSLRAQKGAKPNDVWKNGRAEEWKNVEFHTLRPLREILNLLTANS
jgi:hypothetical protein